MPLIGFETANSLEKPLLSVLKIEQIFYTGITMRSFVMGRDQAAVVQCHIVYFTLLKPCFVVSAKRKANMFHRIRSIIAQY